MPAGPPLPPVIGTLYKKPAEIRLFDFRFGNYQEFAERPAETGIASAIINYVGTDASLNIGPIGFSGSTAQFTLSGGTPGSVYTLTCIITTTPSSYVLEQDGILKMSDD
jgi:hypothetical protein